VKLRCEGGNQSFLDGAVQWKAQYEMVEYAAATNTSSDIRGFW